TPDAPPRGRGLRVEPADRAAGPGPHLLAALRATPSRRGGRGDVRSRRDVPHRRPGAAGEALASAGGLHARTAAGPGPELRGGRVGGSGLGLAGGILRRRSSRPPVRGARAGAPRAGPPRAVGLGPRGAARVSLPPPAR